MPIFQWILRGLPFVGGGGGRSIKICIQQRISLQQCPELDAQSITNIQKLRSLPVAYDCSTKNVQYILVLNGGGAIKIPSNIIKEKNQKILSK